MFRNEGGSFGITLHVTSQFIQAGYSAIEAANRAEGQLYSMLTHQASLLCYVDCFVGLVVPASAGLILAAAIKNFRPPVKPAGAH